MNLLLLLSALLSALTGVGSAARAPVAAQAISAQAGAAVVQARAVRIAHRPHQALATPVRAIFAAPLPAILTVAAPLYASRRRE